MSSTLEKLKEKLKIKPIVEPRQQISIIVPTKREKVDINVVIEDKRETGYDRDRLKERLKEHKMTKVNTKGPEAVIDEILVQEEPINKTNKRPRVKKTKKLVVLENGNDGENGHDGENGNEGENGHDGENENEGENGNEHAVPLVNVEVQDVELELVKRRKKLPKGITVLGQGSWVEFGDTPIAKRLPEKQAPLNMKVSSYYMNDREIFVNFINSLFEPYRKEMESSENNITCENIGQGVDDFNLLTHQLVIRDYMNLYTPYRGLLLFHGLGSGKTCSSIAIAEGMKSGKKVIVMTPASLKRNYIEELKKCGDSMYKKNQYWEWIPYDASTVDTVSSILQVSVDFIVRQKGCWFVNVTKESNYSELASEQKKSLDNQIDEMIASKYTFINYNGLRRKAFSTMTSNFEKNIFDNSVVVIDEAHNFISRIANKIEKEKPITLDNRGEQDHVAKNLSLIMYDQLLRANNCRIVLLTGTPIINYPNEIGILFNILRGYIKTWEIDIKVTGTAPADKKRKINTSFFQDLFLRERVVDYIDFSPARDKLLVTRNPFGFKNKIKERSGYHGVTTEKRDATGNSAIDTDYVSDDAFEKRIIGILKSNNVEVVRVKINNYTALPEKLDSFIARFIDDEKKVKDINMFKRRIVGLTSYFRSAQEDLLPRYEKTPQYHHILNIPMSDYQFKVYEAARKEERRQESKNKKKQKKVVDGLYTEPSSTYRIFSRLFCNFVMPVPPGRPMPIRVGQVNEGENGNGEKGEKDSEILVIEDLIKTKKSNKKNDLDEENEEGELEGDVELEGISDATYERRIQDAVKELERNASEYLSPQGLETYSPKFLRVLENITDPEHSGLHLLYSQFRTLEGIGIFTLVLQENGFTRFKLKKGFSGIWEIDIKEEDLGKPTFALYTGTESAEEKEIIRNIYNGDWDYIPTNIAVQLREMNLNNNMGEIIKVLMITSSGSEGINLRNTRYVHIMEPYWHPVRTEQVIGRARRICSHKNLPLPLQTVEVFIYLMTFTEEQKTGEDSIELKQKDLSKRTPKVPLTSDEALYEICVIKEEVNSQLIKAVKEASIDCAIYSKGSKEGLQCLSFGEPSNTKFAYNPDIEKQHDDTIQKINLKSLEWVGKPITIQGIEYVRREIKKGVMYNIYDLESYDMAVQTGNGELVKLIGTLEIKPNKERVFKTIITE